jgi:hypothetical protein
LILYQFLLGRADKLIDEIDEAGTEFFFSYTEGRSNAGGDEASASGAEQGNAPVADLATAGA